MASPAPVAVASVQLSDEERRRIAGELGLDESQLDAVPTKLDIVRFEVNDEAEADEAVSGFSFIPGLNPVVTAIAPGIRPTTHPSVGRIPGGVLIAQFPQEPRGPAARRGPGPQSD